jgi:hypothetical protein
MGSRLEEGLRVYAQRMGAFLVGKLKERYGGRWEEAYAQALNEKRRESLREDLRRGKSLEEAVDLVHFKDLLLGQKEVFQGLLGRSFQRAVTWADEVAEVRNKWAHQDDLSEEDIYRALDNMARILEAVGDGEGAALLKALRDGRALASPQPQTASRPDPLPPWWRLATPHADIRSGQFDESTFAAKLDDVVRGTASPEYRYADEFFRKTYLTKELKGLLLDVLKRLSGLGGEAVVQLRTPFGGGKTHALIALYHLLKDAATSGALPEVQALLEEGGLPDIPRARVAVLVGTELSPQGREVEGGVRLHTLWGELAYRLGGLDGYALLREDDEARTAPGKENLARLLGRYAPLLILMDEVLVYQVKAAGVPVGGTTLQAQTFAFFQELSEVVAATPGAALVFTFPESHLEYFDQEGAALAFERLERIFDRVKAVRVPVQGEEVYEVIRRRLFERVDEREAAKVVARYAELYRATRGLHEEAYRAEYGALMRRAFPFHPELVRTLYERWGTLQGFQRTRGVLRLLARIVELSFRSPLARPLIGLGDVALEDPDLRAAIAGILREANWEAVVASDIVGKAAALDREQGGDYARLRLAQTVATAIFMYSHSGGARDGIRRPLLDLALIYPEGITQELVSDALDRLKARLFYLYENGGFLFKAQPNLNAVLANEVAAVPEEAVREALRETLAQVVGKGLFKPVIWPEEHRDVPDDRALKLILHEHPADVEEGRRLRLAIQQNAAGSPRVHRNTLVHLHPRLEGLGRAKEQARLLLALRSLKKNLWASLGQDQRADLEERLKRVEGDLPRLLQAAYADLYKARNSQGEFRYLNIQPYVQTASTLQEAVEEVLRREDLLLSRLDLPTVVDHYRLWPEGEPHLSLGALRDYFLRLPELPMLEGEEVLRQAVLLAVRQGFYQLARRSQEAFSPVWCAQKPPREDEVHLNEGFLLARPGTWPCGEEERPRPNGGSEGGEGAGTGGDGDTVLPPPPPPPPPRPRGPTWVRFHLPHLPLEKIPALVDLVKGLKEARAAEVSLEVVLTGRSLEGLDPTQLDLVVRELLRQHGLAYEEEVHLGEGGPKAAE